MKKMQIAVLAGGDSSEAEVSLRSATQVYESLDRDLFDPQIVVLTHNSWKTDNGQQIDKNDFSFTTPDGQKVKFDYALIMIHGTPGENGILQGYFELLGIPYSSCNTEVSALTFNKSLCKLALSGVQGVNLAREITMKQADRIDSQRYIAELGLPFFIKPNASGSSFGVTKVKRQEDIAQAIETALTESKMALIEEYIEGTEVSQGVMIIGGQEFIMPVTELISKNEFFDYQAKYTDGMTQEITPARIPADVTETLNRTTLEIYRTLGCSGVVRIDYIIREGKPYFIEVNTVPGMSRNSIIPQQWRTMGYTMQQAFTMIITNKPL